MQNCKKRKKQIEYNLLWQWCVLFSPRISGMCLCWGYVYLCFSCHLSQHIICWTKLNVAKLGQSYIVGNYSFESMCPWAMIVCCHKLSNHKNIVYGSYCCVRGEKNMPRMFYVHVLSIQIIPVWSTLKCQGLGFVTPLFLNSNSQG